MSTRSRGTPRIRRGWGQRNGARLAIIVSVSLVAACGALAAELDSTDNEPTIAVAGGSPLVNIRLVIKETFSFGPEETTSIPISDSETLIAGSVVNLEVWAQTDDPGGLSAVSLDIGFDPNEVIVTENNIFPFSGGQFHGFVFSSLTNGTADNGLAIIDNLSGAYVPGAGCMADPTGAGPLNWSRVAVVEMLAVTDSSPTILAGGTDDPIFGTAVCGMSNSPESSIHYTGINEISADLNGDSMIDLLDHAFLLSCQTVPNGDPITPPCDAADINGDGSVDLKDWSWLQSHLQ